MSGKKLKTKLEPGIGRLPIPAYQGDEPYIFVSYAHKDHDRVFTEIKRFNDDGYHVWYDEGITPGNEWTDEIASALSKCSLFIVFLTKNSVKSSNVADEINYVIDEGIPAIAIYLEECELQGGLKLRFQRKQAIMNYQMPEEEYIYKYRKSFDRILERKPEPDEPVEEKLPDKKKEKTSDKTPANKKTVKIAVIAAVAVLVIAGIIIGIVAGANGSKSANYVTSTSADPSANEQPTEAVKSDSSVSQTTDSSDWSDLLNAEPTSTSSFETERQDNFVFLNKFIGDESDVVIPLTFDFIRHYSFSYIDADVKSVVIPDSPSKIISVQAWAFADCKTLERAYMGDGVYFGIEAFKGCTSLRDVRLPSDSKTRIRKDVSSSFTTEGLIAIQDGLFMDCTSLENIVIPDTVTEIDKDAFKNCSSLKTIEIPSSVTEIQTGAFAGCTSLAEVKLNEGLEKLDSGVFTSCPIRELTIPSTVNEIADLSYLSAATFKVYKGSYAEQYMIDNNLTYEVIE